MYFENNYGRSSGETDDFQKGGGSLIDRQPAENTISAVQPAEEGNPVSFDANIRGGQIPGEGGENAGPAVAAAASLDPDMPVEEAFAELERLVKRMETDGISLEESFACYEKGIRLVRFCNEKIDRVEKKVRILQGEGGVSGENPM